MIEVATGEAEVPVGERKQTGEGPQRGRLAGAVRPEQSDDLAGADGQRQVESEGATVHDEVGVEHRTAG